jgi:hypothetical protein
MFTNGQVHLSEHIDSYHSRPEISASMVKSLLEAPELFHWEHILKRRRESTSSMDFGTAVHEDQLLAVWEQSWIEIPKEVLTSNGARRGAAWEAFKAEHKNKILLKAEQVEKLKYIREAIAGNPIAVDLLADDTALNEVSITADAPFRGGGVQPVRGRIDRLGKKIVDFKTISGLDDRIIQYRPQDHRWDVQAVMYQLLVQAIRGGELCDVHFIVVETTVPYRCEVFTPSHSSLAAAAILLQDAIEEIVERTKTGNWHREGWPEPHVF